MSSLDDFMKEFNEFNGGREFDSLEELNDALEAFAERVNHTRQDEIGGLTPEQLHDMLYDPFERTGDIVSFNEALDPELVRTAPIMQDVRLVLDYFLEHGEIRATAKGFLGRDAMQTLHRAIGRSEVVEVYMPQQERNSEFVYWLRLLLQSLGWIKLRKGYFSLTKAGRSMAERGIDSGHYHRFLRCYASEFDWSFRDGFGDLPIVQFSFLFSLFLARGAVDAFSPTDALVRRFLLAFPQVVEEMSPSPYGGSPEERFCMIYGTRFVMRFAHAFGLFELPPKVPGEYCLYPLAYRVTPLFLQLLKWDR